MAGNAGTPGNVTFTVGSQTYRARPGRDHPNYAGTPGSANDIAVVRLDRTVANVLPAPIYTGSGELGSTTTIAGFGATGTGLTGATEPGGTKRAGRNVFDLFGIYGGNGSISTSATDGPDRTLLITDFDDPRLTDPGRAPNFSGSPIPTDLEYNLAVGDSGGGAFINVGGIDYVAGVNVAIADTFTLPGAASNDGTYGDLSLFTRVSRYENFITTAVPEPSAAGLLGLAALYATRRPARRSRRLAASEG